MAQNDPTKVPPAPADGPDLSPDLGPAPLTLTPAELQAAIDTAVAAAVEQAAATVKQATRPTRGQATVVPDNPHAAPAEPTWEPPFIPSPADYAAANEAVKRGELVDEPIPVAGTIVAVAPNGDRIYCTPKAFRVLYRGRGYKAHPEDARRGLTSEARPTRRRRGGGNVMAAEELEHIEPAAASGRRPRRRRTDDD